MRLPERSVIDNFKDLQKVRKQDVALTAYLIVTQDQVNQFAGVSMDRQWIHIDVDRAKSQSPFNGTIAHGLLTLSMAAHFLMDGVLIRGASYGLVTALNYARFISPVPVGSQIRGRLRLSECEQLKDSFQAMWMITVERKGGIIPACVTEFVVRYYA